MKSNFWIIGIICSVMLGMLACDDASPQASADWKIVGVQSRITSRDSSGITFGWKVTIRNDSSTPGNFVGQVHFLDKDGFEIANDYFNLGDNLLVPPGSEHIFSGSTFLYNQQNAAGVANITATARRD